MVVVFGSFRIACSTEDYCSPLLWLLSRLGAKVKTQSPSLVAFYDSPGISGQAYSSLLAKLNWIILENKLLNYWEIIITVQHKVEIIQYRLNWNVFTYKHKKSIVAFLSRRLIVTSFLKHGWISFCVLKYAWW